ncbi:MAG: TatD family hydrolase [Alphaproteobacteria bacterium]|nr:TatD family hydrolase [Alphaproteobacteria bacterium]
MIDSHCHLFYEEIFNDLYNKLNFAYSMGVTNFLTVGTDNKHMLQNIDIANKYSNIVCSIGIHPTEYNCGYDIEEMRKLPAQHNKIVAIGEVGLDYHYIDLAPKDKQLLLFEEMLQLAKDTNLPVILHCRECFNDDLFKLIKKYTNNAVFHCFTDTLDNAKKVIDEGFYLSLTGIVTFKNSGELREVAKYVPDDRLLIETDSPYLAPIPHRGKSNEPGFVRHVAECICEQRKCTLKHLSDITDENFYRLFPKAEIMLERK